jgi:ABC transporter substrate binding protein (PQQ-dependent alcohol dehydrogenase system)
MLRQALAEAPAARPGATAEAWDPALVRFGADTLNERFQNQFHRPMTAATWTAWMAIKIAWEASLRAQRTDGGAIGAFLRTPAAQFDGHKGRALSFRTWDHQLRQPVYVTRSGPTGSPLGDEPFEVPSSRAEEDARTSLDRLGIGQAASTCTWNHR